MQVNLSLLPDAWRVWPSKNANADVLLLLHGFMGAPADFSALATRLTRRFHCVAPVLKGHGSNILPKAINASPKFYSDSASDFTYGLARQAQQIKADLALAGIHTFHILGYSMGGRTALQFLTDPALRSLVLTACHLGFSNVSHQQNRFQQDQSVAARLLKIAESKHKPSAWADFLDDFWYRLPLFGSLREHPDYAQLLQRRMAHDPRHLAAAVLQASSTFQENAFDTLIAQAKSIPCLYIVGEQDRKYAKIAHELQVQGVPVAVVSDAAHAVHLEQPMTYVEQLELFFAGF